ncbi:hypothetical protein EVAR_93670_1 [Eumeta japonica]|uniref:Uncharacterized protein n=1 Tax=Eumeta variegata TaxID=151549 RepID=A0A4C1TQP4_EUMVA|nr:hypothetical protein EVAR_93670_1 [Eumeta japonica]
MPILPSQIAIFRRLDLKKKSIPTSTPTTKKQFTLTLSSRGFARVDINELNDPATNPNPALDPHTGTISDSDLDCVLDSHPSLAGDFDIRPIVNWP